MKANKPFLFAHGGHTVRSYSAGDELPADAATWASKNGYAEAETTKQPEPVKEKPPAKKWSKNK